MSKDITPARERVADIHHRAARVAAFTVDIQKKNGVTITDTAELAQASLDAALKDPMFEGVDQRFVKRVSSAWTSAMMQYQKSNGGELPAPDVLANAQYCCENLMLEAARDSHEGTGHAMFESVAADMRTSDGILRLAQFVALILPVSLGAATSDACTFVPCDRDQADIYELLNIAGTEFGSFKVGDELHKHQPDGLTYTTLMDGMKDLLERFYAAGALVTPRDPLQGTEPFTLTLVQKDIDLWELEWAVCPTGSLTWQMQLSRWVLIRMM